MATKYAARSYITRYGTRWDAEQSDLDIELYCISKRGKWKQYPKDKNYLGAGLTHHLLAACKILWPHIDQHRWTTLCCEAIANNKVSVIMGPGSSCKTNTAAWVRLLQYYASPEDTCILVSSTDIRGLQLRVWGEIKMLHTMAKEKFPELPGNLIESRLALATDDIDEDEVRDLRRGVIGVPTMQNGRWTGIGKWVGIKQKHLYLIADEASLMGGSFLNAFANLDKNPDFQATVLGNPNDILDPLGKAAEPIDGWSGHLEPTKTCTWRTRFMNGICVNLVGTDSPNFDYPANEPTRFPYLISREKINNTLSFFPKDSAEYYSQCVGVMKIGTLARRVLTRDLAIRYGARDPVVWMGDERTKIFALDAAYGGDRCVGGHIEFGKDVEGRQVAFVHQPEIVPIVIRDDVGSPEEQIAVWIKEYCEGHGIPPENAFHDSTGRGGLGTAISREWSAMTNPVDFGGKPTPRPVSLEMYIFDPKERRKRLKRCDEHYDRFVTELWWTVRLCVESKQMRGLPEAVLEEFCMREWDKIRENKMCVETKKEMKERVGRSPDLADWCFEGKTLVSTPIGKKRIDSLKVGDEILTPMGITRVHKIRVKNTMNLTTATFSDSSQLVGLGEHRVFTWNKGWVRMDWLNIADEIETEYNLPLWRELGKYFTTDGRTTFKAMVDTIQTGTTTRRRDYFTGASGTTSAVLFLKACASIIRMAIGRITNSKTLNLFRSQIMEGFTWLKDLRMLDTKQRFSTGRSVQLSRPLTGINPLRGEPGTQRMEGSVSGSRDPQNVHGVAKCSLNSLREKKETTSVHFRAQAEHPGFGPRTITQNALSAAKHLLRIVTGPRKVAPITVERSSLQESRTVYDLTLEEHNAYYANGILVENCATAIEGARRRGFQISKIGSPDEEQQSTVALGEIKGKISELVKAHSLNYAA